MADVVFKWFTMVSSLSSDHLVCLSHIYRTLSISSSMLLLRMRLTSMVNGTRITTRQAARIFLCIRNVFIPVHPPTSLYRFPEAYFAGHNHGRFIRFISQNIRQHSGGQKPLVFLIPDVSLTAWAWHTHCLTVRRIQTRKPASES